MVDHNTRIQRMEALGVLTPQQANELRKSFHGATQSEPVEKNKRSTLSIWLWLSVFIIFISITVLFSFVGSENTFQSSQEVQDVASTLNAVGGTGSMNKSLSAILVAGVLLILPLSGWLLTYNNLVTKEEQVLASWAQVESHYQRRNDLIPALVETISRYIQHEHKTFVDVTNSRTPDIPNTLINELIDAQKNGANLLDTLNGKPPADQETLHAFLKSQEGIGLTIQRLLGVFENYPDLRASEQFVAMQSQLEGTENRINIARIRFNTAVSEYNTAIRKIPGNLVASIGDFKRKAYFIADESAKQTNDLGYR